MSLKNSSGFYQSQRHGGYSVRILAEGQVGLCSEKVKAGQFFVHACAAEKWGEGVCMECNLNCILTLRDFGQITGLVVR